MTGCCGQLGAHVTAELARRGVPVLGIGHRDCPGDHASVVALDLRRGQDLDAVLRRYRPTHIAHLGGMSSPARVASEPFAGWALNAGVTRQLADYARESDAWLLYPSSDFIWDGVAGRRYLETDTPSRLTAYAASKLDGERAVRGVGLVVRLSLLYGLPLCPRQTTWTRIEAALRAGDEVPVCVDEYRTPVSLVDAARVVVGLGERRVRGLVHVAGPEVLTARDMVVRIAAGLGVEPSLRAVSRRDLPGGLPRPRNMAMSGGLLARHWPALAPRPMRSGPVFGVVIPTYRGADVLGRSVDSLVAQTYSGEVHVVVAVNDGEASTTAAAERLAPRLRSAGIACTVLTSEPGRVAAIDAAEAVLPPGPRLYLDQDAVLSPDGLTRLAEALAPGGGVHFAVPAVRISTGSRVSRAYFRAWRSLPYVRQSPVTMGAYAVSASGRTRWGRFARVRSDDKWVRWHFAPSERAVVSASYEVIVPQGARELVRARLRYQRGNDELDGLNMAHGDGAARHRGVIGALLRSPAAATVFLAVHAAAAVADRWRR
ncbi:hypothetical protein Acsp05_49950 [Actinokineospora sp. NBRC 105648]|nr:hypothetical protein Acsp05_49950 [Actinokineospora sp. NBRC 105648]